MMMKVNGVQFQTSRMPTAVNAKLGLDSQATLNSVPLMRLMMSFMGPLWYNSISAV